MFADDLADAVVHVLQLENPPNLINAGTGVDHTIREIAEMVKATVGFEGAIETDPSKPDGTPRKLMDVSLLKEQGWISKIPLKEGIEMTYKLFLKELEKGNLRER